MAKTYKEYGRKVVDGIDVFEVGQQQYIKLSQWDPISNGIDGNSGVYRHAKGLWVVVSVQSTFGGGTFGSRLYVEYVARSRRDAVERAVWEVDKHTYSEPFTYGTRRVRTAPAVGHDYEVWHIVDDTELWEEWEMLSRAASGDVVAAEAVYMVLGDDTYMRRIEDQYTGGYDIYDDFTFEEPTLWGTVEYEELHPCALSPVRYIYNHMDTDGRILRQRIVIPEHAADDVCELKAHGWKVLETEVLDFEKLEWPCLKILRRDGTKPLVSPLRVCNIYYELVD